MQLCTIVPFKSQVVEKGGKIPARTDWIVLHAHIDKVYVLCATSASKNGDLST